MPYSMETVIEIWDDKNGSHIEIGPDRDALDLVEIRSVTSDNKIEARICFDKEQAMLICEALKRLYERV